MNNKIVIGSRGSKLALIYAQTAKNKIIQNTDLNDEDITIKEITTKGDQVQDQRLSEVGGKGLFSTNIENEQGISVVLSNIVSSQVDVHKEFGGVVPELAARSHMEKIDWIVQKAISESGKK